MEYILLLPYFELLILTDMLVNRVWIYWRCLKNGQHL